GREEASASFSFHRSQSQVSVPPARVPNAVQARRGPPSTVELPKRERPAKKPRIVPTPAPRATLQRTSRGFVTCIPFPLICWAESGRIPPDTRRRNAPTPVRHRLGTPV